MKVWNLRDAGVPDGAVYCGRGTVLGNPHRMTHEGERSYVIERFKDTFNASKVMQASALRLADADVTCHCKPKACHLDYVASWVEQNRP